MINSNLNNKVCEGQTQAAIPLHHVVAINIFLALYKTRWSFWVFFLIACPPKKSQQNLSIMILMVRKYLNVVTLTAIYQQM